MYVYHNHIPSVQAMQLLTLLVLTPPHSHTVTPHLSQLDPFPDGELFWKFREKQQKLREANDQQSLEQEIERFIESGDSLPLSTRVAGLRRLTDMIRGCRGDVVQLLCSGSDSVLKLIRVLVDVASGEHVTTPTVAMEMGRCLGELGGLDLHSISLPAASLSGIMYIHVLYTCIHTCICTCIYMCILYVPTFN